MIKIAGLWTTILITGLLNKWLGWGFDYTEILLIGGLTYLTYPEDK